jgi:site-specific recombinase XerD
VLKNGCFEDIIINGSKRRYIVFHSLRHTFASHWAMKGGDLFKLQKILGHKSVAMTMRYAHLTPQAFNSDFSIFGNSEFNQPSEVVQMIKPASNSI